MAKRREEYILPDGARTTSRERGAVIATPRQVLGAGVMSSSIIPPQFFVGMAQHETNFACNEVDTEPSGFTSWGIFQIGAEEAREVGMEVTEALDLVLAAKMAARLLERRLERILVAAKLDQEAPASWPVDVWAYLAIAHNQGLGSATSGKGALGTIARYGLNWQAYKQRNGRARIVSSGYGDDATTGGQKFKCPC